MSKDLIIGYGNPDRQDDGVAWHVLVELCAKLDRPIPAGFEEGLFPTGENPDLMFILQLMPEISEEIADYDRVCFIDAHTGNIEKELNWEKLSPEYTSSPFTHHMTPATCLYLTSKLFNAKPDGVLISIRGYEFGFSHQLSDRTQELAGQAVNMILDWLEKR